MNPSLATTSRHIGGHRAVQNAMFLAVLVIAQLLYCTTAQGQGFGPWGPAASVDPDRLTVNTPWNDGCPIEAPDGDALYIASNRAGTLGQNDIWVAHRASGDGGWNLPENVAEINSSVNDICPTPLTGFRFLFVSSRADNCGGSGNNPDIYSTRRHPVRGWLPPEPLGCDVNSGFEEFSPSLVETDGLTLLFFSSNRDDGSHHKIYMSVLQPDGRWFTTRVDELNWEGASDARPNVRKDGLEIVFDSARAGGPPQIFSATRSSIYDPWSRPEPLGSNVNLAGFAQTRPTLSRDGTRLYFGSTRDNVPGDLPGSADVFMSTRPGPGHGQQK
jgi:hypothetical protein